MSLATRQASISKKISQGAKRHTQRTWDDKIPRYAITRLEVIHLTVNGENRQFAEPLTIRELVARLELTGKRIALERNGEIVPRSQLDQVALADGDTLEIVVAVGGG